LYKKIILKKKKKKIFTKYYIILKINQILVFNSMFSKLRIIKEKKFYLLKNYKIYLLYTYNLNKKCISNNKIIQNK